MTDLTHALFEIKCLKTGVTRYWTITDVLDEINRDHSGDYTLYDTTDWREGWSEWCEGYTYAMQGVTL